MPRSEAHHCIASRDLIPAGWCACRQRLHHLAPEGEGRHVPGAGFAAERAAVTAIWDATFKTGA